MKQVREVLRLHLLVNLSSRKIQGATGVARTTVQDYIKRCNDANVTDLCKELKITRATLYKYISPTGELRDYAERVLEK